MTALSETWRYVDCRDVDAFENNAQMAVLARSATDAGQPILQTSVWGATHLNVGWFDDVDSTLDLAACDRLGIQVIRRPFAGGGTAFYARGCAVMWGVMFPKPGEHDDLDEEIARFQPLVLDALGRIGLGEVHFEGSADLRWHGRKLGGISAGDFGRIISVGGFFNIERPDLDLYLRVARVPDDKFKDKLVTDMREYVCTAAEVAGHPVTYDAFRESFLGAADDAGVAIEERELTDIERGALKKIGNRIATDDSVRRVSSERFRADHTTARRRVGFGNHKGRKLCRAGVALDDTGTVVATMMAGDMHVSPPDTLDRIATALVGANASEDGDVHARIASVLESADVQQADATTGITTDDLHAAFRRAVDDAKEASP